MLLSRGAILYLGTPFDLDSDAAHVGVAVEFLDAHPGRHDPLVEEAGRRDVLGQGFEQLRLGLEAGLADPADYSGSRTVI